MNAEAPRRLPPAILPVALVIAAVACGACARTPPSPYVSSPAIALVPAFPGLPELERPVALVEVPEHDLFLIALREGRVLAIPRGGPWNAPRTVHDQRGRTRTGYYEDGLLSLALDPDFARNGYVYAWYSPSDLPRANRLVRFETTGAGASFAFDAASELIILEVEKPGREHNGGTLLFGPDGMLYLGIGDGALYDPYGHGQNPGTLLGAIVRIDVRDATADEPYAIPPDNPFRDREGARPEVWAYGLRNPWRMSFDRETGLLWAGDVGQDAAEEINVIRAGANYGWSVMEGAFCRIASCDRAGSVPPVHEYGHDIGCVVIGGYVYRGEAIPALRGWYVFTDHCESRMFALPAGPAAAGETPDIALLREGGPASVASFAEDAAGELYVVSFRGQRIYRIVSAAGEPRLDARIHRIESPRTVWERAAASAPVASSLFDVYLLGEELIYARQQCASEDTEVPFFLHVTPVDADDLLDEGGQYGFDNLDFRFGLRGGRFDGRCVASVRLPDYAIAGIRTGQFTDEVEIWSVEFAP